MAAGRKKRAPAKKRAAKKRASTAKRPSAKKAGVRTKGSRRGKSASGAARSRNRVLPNDKAWRELLEKALEREAPAGAK